ncbi:Hemin ABC transporter, permease protein [Pseudoalteromonas luteoviolacea B = ATCC 29581]|nr:Hemin ABC transporter, permease protein [Pseudoalteromonas luteoviolacea B = ATCC 29581]
MLAVSRFFVFSTSQKCLVLVVLSLTLATSMLVSLSVGGVSISVANWLAIAAGDASVQGLSSVLTQIRLPRLVLAVMVGASLAATGAAMQAIFRNPLADPGLIGISSGAALGAIITIVLGSSVLGSFVALFGLYAIPVGAFLGGVVVCGCIYRLTLRAGQFNVISLLLAGIAINAIVGAFIGILTITSNDQELRDLTFWSMGSLAGNTFDMILPALIVMTFSCASLYKQRIALNLYVLGEQSAKHLGVDVNALKKRVFLLTACAVGAAVALCGIIGFVGFIVPHIVRMFLGPDHKYLLPASMLGGAILMSIADLVSRTIVLPSELPIGLITSALGGPFFLWMLLKMQSKQSF